MLSPKPEKMDIASKPDNAVDSTNALPTSTFANRGSSPPGDFTITQTDYGLSSPVGSSKFVDSQKNLSWPKQISNPVLPKVSSPCPKYDLPSELTGETKQAQVQKQVYTSKQVNLINQDKVATDNRNLSPAVDWPIAKSTEPPMEPSME